MIKKSQDIQIIQEHLQDNRIKKYIKGRSLGKGGFAECYQFISQQTGKHYAAKVIDKESLAIGKTKQKLQSQIVIHKSLHHKNIVKPQLCLYSPLTLQQQRPYLVTQTLNQLLKRRRVLTEIQIRFYLTQLLHALQYIHSQKVIHRDLKLGNLFLSDSLELKVGDFGLATSIHHQGQRRKTMCGTPNYIAPQILQSKNNFRKGKKGHSFQVDIWSTGVITYALLFGKPPFQTNQVKITYQKIKLCEFSFPKLNVSNLAKDFISRMLILNPSNRATITQLLCHQFISTDIIPKNLPLSTLACPPNAILIQFLKNSQYLQSSSSKKFQLLQQNINSSRISKSPLKKKSLISVEKNNFQFFSSKIKRCQRSQGSFIRNFASSTTNINKHTVPSQIFSVKLDTLVTFYLQESKYGLFYKLSNGVTGMKFNDQTCLFANRKSSKFRYIILHNAKQKDLFTFYKGQEPEFLYKKMKIFNHFSKTLLNKYDNFIQPTNPIQKLKGQIDPFSLYLHSYYNTNHYTLMILSNDLFQVKFKDNSEIIFYQSQILYFNNQRNPLFIQQDLLDNQSQQFKTKYNHVSALIKKIIKKKKQSLNFQKSQKENNYTSHTNFHSKHSKQSLHPIERQASSTSSLHYPKRPLYQSIKNRGKKQVFRNKQNIL